MNTSAFKPVLMALVAGTLAITSTCLAQTLRPTPVADNGAGTYSNPPLYADFPDPDIVRVGDDFYFATTTFANTPGLTILHSRDLVYWEYAAHVLPRLDGREPYDLKNGNAYRNGIYAPSLRYHDGIFYAAVTPNDLWKAIAPCWNRIADENSLPVTLEVSFSPIGNLAKPPVIKRNPAMQITDRMLRSESQAISALSECGPYLMAFGQSGVQVNFPQR